MLKTRKYRYIEASESHIFDSLEPKMTEDFQNDARFTILRDFEWQLKKKIFKKSF